MPLRIKQDVVSAIRQWCLQALLLCTCAVNVYAHELPANAFELITHQSTDLRDLSEFDVRRIFSGQKKQWSDGRKIRVFVLPTTSNQHKEFCRTVLKVFPYQLERLWNQLLYSGQWEAPEVVPDVETMRERVKQTQGAIGYVPSSASPALEHKDVTS